MMISLSNVLNRLISISLKWKLLIPFLCFSFAGTTILVYIGLSSQEELIRKEERKGIHDMYNVFLAEIDHKKVQALSLASVVAESSETARLLSNRDRESLEKLAFPLYELLKREYGILQFHFHIPPGKSFLRLHLPEEFGEMLSYRRAPVEVMRSGKGVAGLEWGLAGLGIRGVAPVFHEGALAGTVEVGFPLDENLLEILKTNWGPDFAVYEKTRGTYILVASTHGTRTPFSPVRFLEEEPNAGETPVILISPPDFGGRSILIGPVKDYMGRQVAMVVVDADRSGVKRLLSQKRNLMILVGVLGLFVSFGLTWLVASLFIRPIREIVREAQEIAQGKRESRLHGRPNDEIGVLTHSLNMMLDALKERQKQIQEYARTLEHRVEERTSDLVDSEEKYRTLVENLPLVVYRILPDGTTEFVNSYFTEKLGYRAEEVGRDRDFWLEKICGSRRSEEGNVLRACWKQGEPYRMERVVKDKEGRLHTFIDHAIPFKDGQGRVKWVDGNMVEITVLKRLQEMAIREEEIKTLGQISARFAHELRNPLTTAGGFARRLHDSLPEGDPGRKSAAIIVEQVARLESILRIILSSIEPFTLCVSKVDLNHLLRSLTGDLHRQFEKKRIRIKETLSPDLPMIQGDEMLLNKAFENLLRNAMIGMPEGEELILSTLREDDHVVATISHLLPFLAEEDLDQFFFPRFNGMAGAALPELPLSKIIVHRHGGKVDVMRNSGSRIVLRIELPSEL